MRIQNSDITMDATTSNVSFFNINERLNAWLGDKSIKVESSKIKTTKFGLDSVSSSKKNKDEEKTASNSNGDTLDLTSSFGTQFKDADESIQKSVKNFDRMLQNYNKIQKAAVKLKQAQESAEQNIDQFTLAGSLTKLVGRFKKFAYTPPVDNNTEDSSYDTKLDSKERVTKYLMEKMTGFKFKISYYDDAAKTVSNTQNQAPTTIKAEKTESADTEQPQQSDWGLEYSKKVTHYESETLKFVAKGTIKTEDGQEIKFKLSYKLSREYFTETSTNVLAGNAALKDPLVINFDGDAAKLTDTKFKFDLDNDGAQDNIPFLQPGSGFLVFDKDNSGTVTNGSEIIGTQTGDAYTELSSLDSDRNGWIDKADESFDKLKVWSKDSEGNQKVDSLIQKNIAALYLKNQLAMYQYKNSQNNLLAQQVSSGVFVRNNGSVGSLQQLNLTV